MSVVNKANLKEILKGVIDNVKESIPDVSSDTLSDNAELNALISEIYCPNITDEQIASIRKVKIDSYTSAGNYLKVIVLRLYNENNQSLFNIDWVPFNLFSSGGSLLYNKSSKFIPFVNYVNSSIPSKNHTVIKFNTELNKTSDLNSIQGTFEVSKIRIYNSINQPCEITNWLNEVRHQIYDNHLHYEPIKESTPSGNILEIAYQPFSKPSLAYDSFYNIDWIAYKYTYDSSINKSKLSGLTGKGYMLNLYTNWKLKDINTVGKYKVLTFVDVNSDTDNNACYEYLYIAVDKIPEETGNVEESSQMTIEQGKVLKVKDCPIILASMAQNSLNYLDTLSYGVEWDANVADPKLIRIGNLTYHKTLPIQSRMKGCIYNPKEKKVVYWLDKDDWKYKEGGNPDKGETEALARLDGYDGEVMVYVPEFWIKSWDEEDKRQVRISTMRIDDTWEYQPATFIAAYRDTVLNTVPEDMGYLSTLEQNTAISVMNNSAYCRGGNNNPENDANEDVFKRQLGKCRTNISRATFRTYARKANKEIMSYRQYKNIMYWLYVIEYANFNSQATYNAALTAEGFHQGGLGNGLTNVSNWEAYNGYYPISPNGYTNEFGNKTGIKLIAPLGPTPVGGVYATRWRGFENPFGDIWHIVDGIIINSSSIEKNGVKFSEVYTTDKVDLYSDSNYQAMTKVGEEFNGGNGYVKEWDLGETAEIIPRSNGGDSTQYKCDYHHTDIATGLRILLLGGGAHAGGFAGLGRFSSHSDVGHSYSEFGFRTSCEA